MKKTFKTALCILLCLSTLFAFAGCETAADREAAAIAAAENYMSAICALNMEGAAAYAVEGEAMLQDLEFKNAEDVKTLLMDAMLEGAGTEFSPYADKFSPILDTVITGLQNSFSYEITSASVDGDAYLVSGSFTHMNFDADMEEIFNIDENALNEILTRVATKVMESGQITAQTTETELLEMMIDPLVSELEPIIKDAMAKIPNVQEDIALKVEKKDGAWLVNDTDSQLGDMNIMDLL